MWSNPCIGPITSRFGPRTPPAGGASSMHLGTDIGAPSGAPVYAAAAGTVTFSQATTTGGNEIWIQHTGGILTKYLHHSTVQVSRGQVVAQGQQIGTVGRTGTATGNHLHFETHVNGTPQDPQPFMAARGITLGTGAPTTPTAPAQEDDMIYLRVIDNSADGRHKVGDIWEVGELSADKLSNRHFEDIRTTIEPRMKDAIAAAVDRIANRVAARRTHIFGPDKGSK
jgi:hypothetical protein